MRSIRVFGGAICTLAAACGSGSSGDPVSAGAATVAVSNAFVSALRGISAPTRSPADQDLILSAIESQSVRQALTDVVRNAASCNDTCGSGTGSKNVLCSFITTPASCSGGGTVSLSGSIDFAVNCGTRDFTADIAFELGFSNCSSEGVTLNAPTPVRFAGRVNSQGSNLSVNLTLKANGLQVSGNVCSRSIAQTCNIDVGIGGTENDLTVSGQICGCDAAKLNAAQNICSASC